MNYLLFLPATIILTFSELRYKYLLNERMNGRMDFENKFKIHLHFHLATPLLLTYIIEIRVLAYKDACTNMFIATLLLVAKH